MKILLTGANGFVGRHLVPHLQAHGHEIVRLVRGGDEAEGWRVPADLRAVGQAPSWPEGVEAVIHLGALNPSRGQTGAGDLGALRAANVEGSRVLAERALREGVRRFVFLSTANVHAPRGDGAAVTEDDPIRPANAYARSKAEAEATLAALFVGSTGELVVLRPAPMFGAGGRGTVAALARLAATPLPLPLKRLSGRRSLVAVEDLVEAIRLALVEPGAAGGPLLLAGGAATPAAILIALREGLERSPRLLPMPTRLAGMLAGLLGKRQSWDALTGNFVVDSSRAQAALGWAPGATLSERLAASAKGMTGR